MKTLFCILLFAGALAKGCSKIFTKNADEVAIGVVSKLVPHSARVLARQHIIEDDSLSSEDLENWDDVTYTNYFLLDLSKIAKGIDSLDLKDTTYKSRVIRNFNWLKENNLNYSIEKMKDSTNLDLKDGASYFRNLYLAKNYSEFKEYFKDEQVYIREFIVEKDPSKDDDELLRLIFEDYYFRNYFPFHEGLADKILNETE
jgi:hypothetical protein